MAQGDSYQMSGAHKPSEAENREHEGFLYAKRTVDVPSNMQARWIYDANGFVLYAGYAPRGLAEATKGWLLQSFTIANNLTTQRLIGYDSWANATTASYS